MAKVEMAAMTWLLVQDEAKRPTAMNEAPRRKMPRYPERMGIQSGLPTQARIAG
ncbi:hypothetical protein D3C72_2552400 [compost metagenome]